MVVTIDIPGNPNGKYIYSTVIIDEDDLFSCEARLYCADSVDEVANFLEAEGISEMNFTNPKNIGQKN